MLEAVGTGGRDSAGEGGAPAAARAAPEAALAGRPNPEGQPAGSKTAEGPPTESPTSESPPSESPPAAAAPGPFALRLAEAVLFASRDPLTAEEIAARLPEGSDVAALLARLAADYAGRGVHLVAVAGRYMFQTAPDLGFALARRAEEARKPSRAAMETLAIIAYHQPVTRAEIEAVRGVATARGTLDVLIEAGWIRMRGRRRSPGRPVTWGTTEGFLVDFGLGSLDDLPGVDELAASGFLDAPLPPPPAGAAAARPGRRSDAGPAADAAETEDE